MGEAQLSEFVVSQALEKLFPSPDQYVNDPVGWVKYRRGAHITRQQKRVLESVRDNRYTAVHSAHDLGKSFTAGNLATWWIDTHPVGEAKVVTTAPTGDQVKGIVWQEIQQAHAASGAPGKVLQTEWWIDAFQAGMGRKPADYNPAAFQGIHSKYVLVIIDEACGVPKGIFDAADALVTNEFCRAIAIGNPDDATSHFATVCKPGSGWNVIHLDGLESPLFTDEKKETPLEVQHLLLSPVWVDERKRRWGESSPIYQAKVRGLFPEDAPDGVVRTSAVAKCQIGKEYLPTDKRLQPVELGVDIGAGGDKTVIIARYGQRPEVFAENNSSDPEQVTGAIIAAIRETRAAACKIDTIGWGWGVYGNVKQNVREAGLTCEIIPVSVAERSSDPEKFPLVRDEIWWTIGREMSEEGAWDLSKIGDDAIADLLAPKWAPDSRGRVKVEPKDETRKRLGRSPDHADALLLAFYTGKTGLESYLDALVRKTT